MEYEVLSCGSSDEAEVWFVPRDEWPDHRFFLECL